MARKRGAAKRPREAFGLGKTSSRQVHRIVRKAASGASPAAVKGLYRAQVRTARDVARRGI